MWRHPDEDSVLLMARKTTSYAVEPRGDHVFGVVVGQALRSALRSSRGAMVALIVALVACLGQNVPRHHERADEASGLLALPWASMSLGVP
jgi:hypothetical protein